MSGNFALNTAGIPGLVQYLMGDYDGNIVDFGNEAFATPIAGLTIFGTPPITTPGITIALVVAGNSTPLTVSTATGATRDITVNVATSAGAAPTSTFAQIATAINGNATAFSWVTAAGTGATASALAKTAALAFKYVETDARKLAELRAANVGGVAVFTET